MGIETEQYNSSHNSITVSLLCALGKVLPLSLYATAKKLYVFAKASPSEIVALVTLLGVIAPLCVIPLPDSVKNTS